jgi:dihydropteroate synthase
MSFDPATLHETLAEAKAQFEDACADDGAVVDVDGNPASARPELAAKFAELMESAAMVVAQLDHFRNVEIPFELDPARQRELRKAGADPKFYAA